MLVKSDIEAVGLKSALFNPRFTFLAEAVVTLQQEKSFCAPQPKM